MLEWEKKEKMKKKKKVEVWDYSAVYSLVREPLR